MYKSSNEKSEVVFENGMNETESTKNEKSHSSKVKAPEQTQDSCKEVIDDSIEGPRNDPDGSQGRKHVLGGNEEFIKENCQVQLQEFQSSTQKIDESVQNSPGFYKRNAELVKNMVNEGRGCPPYPHYNGEHMGACSIPKYPIPATRVSSTNYSSNSSNSIFKESTPRAHCTSCLQPTTYALPTPPVAQNTQSNSQLRSDYIPQIHGQPPPTHVQQKSALGQQVQYYIQETNGLSEMTPGYATQANGKSSNVSQNSSKKTMEFKRIEECRPKLDNLSFNSQLLNGRKVYSLIAFPITGQSFPMPFPTNAQSLKDIWDDRHVKMPYSKRNGNEWQHIKSLLKNDFKTSEQLEDTIKKYNKFNSNKNFNVLRQFFKQYRWENFQQTVNFMAQLAIKLPNIVTQSVPLLKSNERSILFISQYQIACLLANAFFCTFPRRNRKNDEYKNFPVINFGSLDGSLIKRIQGQSINQGNKEGLLSSLFIIEKNQIEMKIKMEKLKCIFTYFEQINQNKPNGVITFERRSHNNQGPHKIFWEISDKTLSGVKLEAGTIEKEGKGFIEVDFANKYIGGGVLNSGCVQEELRFLMCPELIVSRLFTEMLTDTETLVITGCQQYNIIKGYSHQFEYVSNNDVPLRRDEWRRYYSQVVAMDAMEFPIKDDPNQFQRDSILRTLNKAYCGFYDFNSYSSGTKPAIASGKWGCGAFNGDPYLACLLQHMAASQLDRNLIIYIQNDMNFKKEYEEFYRFAINKNLEIGQIIKLITAYNNNSSWQGNPKNIFDFIINRSKM